MQVAAALQQEEALSFFLHKSLQPREELGAQKYK
jgi:hypothetical protein